jgi:hypothetical protein
MNNKLTTRQLATMLRIAGFILAVYFLYILRSDAATMPESGFMSKAFCNLMAATGALIFTIGSVLRFRAIMKDQKNDETPNNQEPE